MLKEILSVTAIGLTFVALFPYIRSIRRGVTRPHVFSWVIWGLTTLIAFFAQVAGHSGAGAWPIGVSALITIYIALLAYLKRNDTALTRTDAAFLFAALSALPFWFFTSDPLWAVVILTAVDVVGFGPTFRQAYLRPHQESARFFLLYAVRNVLVILALEHYSLTTILFPAAVGAGCLLLSGLIVARRRGLSENGLGEGIESP